jgi:asparaginyl-tRNA synthetase
VKDKAKYFHLNIDDYEPYIESREISTVIHSGWGMGIERFIQWILLLPFIWDAAPFPRVDLTLKP